MFIWPQDGQGKKKISVHLLRSLCYKFRVHVECPQVFMFQISAHKYINTIKIIYYTFDLISQVNVNGKYVGKEREKRAHD